MHKTEISNKDLPMSAGDWKEMFNAAVDGELGLLRYHLAAQVDPNYQHPEYMCTPLVACILAGKYDAAALLLQWGADPTIRSESEGMTPLEAAHQRQETAMIKLILFKLQADADSKLLLQR
jgi:ankyrin repeat protein